MRLKIIIIFLVVFILVFIGGFLFFFSKGPITGPSGKLEIYQGKIINLKKGVITLGVNVPASKEAGPVNFYIGAQSELYQYSDKVKSPEQFAQEQNKFKQIFAQAKKEGKNIAFIEAPSPKIKEKININDLSAGQQVEVFAYRQGDRKVIKKLTVKFEQQLSRAPENKKFQKRWQGKITAIKNDFLTVQFVGSEETGRVVVASTTRIIKKTPKAKEVFAQEQAEFKKKLAQLPTDSQERYTLKAPSVFREEQITFEQLAVSQIVVVWGSERSGRLIAQKIEVKS